MQNKSHLQNNNAITIKDFLKALIFGGFIAFMITRFVVPTTINGISMYPKLDNNDLILVNVFDKTAKIGDIVAFKYEGETLMKRVIAKEGNHIIISEGNVYLDGILIDEPYLIEKKTFGNCNTKVPEGYIFVLGDNRRISYDSRSFGLIKSDLIVGKFLYKLF